MDNIKNNLKKILAYKNSIMRRSSRRSGGNVSVPSKYSSKSSYSPSSSSLITEETVMKGGKKEIIQNVDIDILNDIVSNLRDHAHYKTDKLPKDVKHNFNQLINLVEILYDTNTYHVLTDIVIKKFSDLDNITPGTVGAYCAGCSVETTFDGSDKSCSSICAGSMPIKGSSDILCKHTVILANKSRKGYNFSMLRSGELSNESSEDNNKGYVFIPHTDIDEFPGFTKREMRKISHYGIDTVYLYGYDSTGKEHYRLDIKGVYDLKARKSPRGHVESGSSDVTNNIWLYFIVLFALLLIGGFLLSNYWRRGRL
uniref:Transmembrane protein n=1 Tax=Pithovirus LCPAC101 TaxID=2506586 RepID=A0A481Z2H7_9VIRU|nr:MAG: uncharacterized protein LCPAC101_02500 [Pithovirus LCPAC101]